MRNPVEILGARADALARYGALAMAGAVLGATFVVGTMFGEAHAECNIITRNRVAIMAADDYWQGPLRTVVESCDRGEGM